MRSLAVALALVLPLLATGSAQQAEPALSDPDGDVVLVFGGGPLQPPASPPAAALESARSNDLLSLRAAETEEAIVFAVQVASLAGSSVSSNTRLRFGWSGGEFELQMVYFRDATLGVERVWGTLAERDGDERRPIAPIEPVVDAEAGTLAAEVPKAYLVSADDRLPGRGDVVALRHVEAGSGAVAFPFAAARTYDRMPDSGDGGATLTLERGDFSQGSIVVSSPDRVRVSNGGATTFVFQVSLRNTADVDDEYALEVADAPAGWNASVRSPLKVPAQGERTIGVLVSVPFAHDHGGYSSFNLTVQSTRDPGTSARMRMGVLHTPIPQPAGHHSELYLHAEERSWGGVVGSAVNTAFPSARGWMNTQADHADDAAYVTPEVDGERIVWRIPLDPPLRLGLDFDLDRLGELKGSILGKRDAETTLRATLLYETGGEGGGESLVLAEVAEAPLTLDTQTPTPFVLRVTPTAESDYIAHRPDARMTLELSIDAAPTDQERGMTTLAPQLMVEDFVLSLPLNEYHDRLTGVAEAAQELELLAQGPVEKHGLPGTVLTYPFTVRNGGPPDVYIVSLAGNDAREGIVVPRGPVALSTGETRNVTLAVEIPLDANPGQEFEVLLFVHARDDPSKMAIARTKTFATHAAEEAVADETHLLLDAQARESEVPAAHVVLVLAAVALLALARRR